MSGGVLSWNNLRKDGYKDPIRVGDRINVEMTSYDIGKNRVACRHKDERARRSANSAGSVANCLAKTRKPQTNNEVHAIWYCLIPNRKKLKPVTRAQNPITGAMGKPGPGSA